MVRTLALLGSALMLTCLLATTGSALANGRKPGVRLTDVDAIATCKDWSGAEHALIRALAGGERVLRIRLGSAQGEIPLVQVQRVTFLPRVSEDGYAMATVELGGELQSRATLEDQRVKVRDGEEDILLTGHSPIGLELQIPLAECQSIAFQPLIKDQVEPMDNGGVATQ